MTGTTPSESPAASAAPPLTPWLKMVFALGSTAEALVITTTTGLLLLYYNQVRGAPAELVGLALAAGLVVNAIADPLVGSWSDRTRSRLGRRHPFMFASLLPVALAYFAVFNPPAGLDTTGEMIWLGTTNIALVIALTAFHTPHLAFGGELSTQYLERSSVMSYNTFFLWLGDTTGWLLMFAVFFPASAEFPNGILNPEPWPRFSLAVAAIVLTALFVSTWFTRSRIPHVAQMTTGTPGFGGREFLRDVWWALTNRNYVELLIGLFFLSIMTGVRSALWLYTATFYWQLTNAQLAFFVIGSFVGYVFGSYAVTRLHARFDKRWTGAIALVFYCLGPAIPLLLGHFDILTPATPGLLAILIAFSTLQHAPYSIMTTTVYSALADIADENELKHGVRQEGVLYSTRTLFGKIDQAIGTALAGWLLAYIAFPTKAVPGEVAQPVLDALAMSFVLAAVPGLLAAVFYARVQVTRESHDRTRRALIDARRLRNADVATS